jgi:hypothetical protein
MVLNYARASFEAPVKFLEPVYFISRVVSKFSALRYRRDGTATSPTAEMSV